MDCLAIALVHPCNSVLNCTNLAVSTCDRRGAIEGSDAMQHVPLKDSPVWQISFGCAPWNAVRWRSHVRRHLRHNIGIHEMLRSPILHVIFLKLLLMLSVGAVRLQVVAVYWWDGSCWRNHRIPRHHPCIVWISDTCFLEWYYWANHFSWSSCESDKEEMY